MMEGEIYVINLARRPDRWQHWTQQAKQWGFPAYKRFDAIDGQNLTLTDDLKHLFRNNNFDNHLLTIGCALSHFYLWMHQYEKQIPYLVVFEDDAIFTQPFRLPQLPDGWDLFYFGGAPYPNVKPPGIHYSKDIVIPKLFPQQSFTTVAYMISLAGCAKILKQINEKGIGKHIDRFLVDMHSEINVFCYSPLTVYFDINYSLGSDINRPFNSEEF